MLYNMKKFEKLIFHLKRRCSSSKITISNENRTKKLHGIFKGFDLIPTLNLLLIGNG